VVGSGRCAARTAFGDTEPVLVAGARGGPAVASADPTRLTPSDRKGCERA
jgi:hypothetical protein